MKLIIMRHGECVGLSDKIINGWRDFELTEQGKKEACEAAEKLKDIAEISNIDKVFTSYLSRANSTAKFLLQKLQLNTEITQDIRLNERHYGMFQGMKREEAYKYPEYNTLSVSAERLDNKLIPMSDEEYEKQLQEYSFKLNLSKDELNNVLPKSESILDVQKRISEFLKGTILIPENKDKTILLVGHANTVKLAVGFIQKLRFEEITKLRFATCGMTIFDLKYENKDYQLQEIININDEWKM